MKRIGRLGKVWAVASPAVHSIRASTARTGIFIRRIMLCSSLDSYAFFVEQNVFNNCYAASSNCMTLRMELSAL